MYRVEVCRVTWHAASISVYQKKDEDDWKRIVYIDMDGPECAIREIHRLIQMDYRICGMSLSHCSLGASFEFTLEGEEDAYRKQPDNETVDR